VGNTLPRQQKTGRKGGKTMKHKLIFTLGLIVLGWAVFAAGPTEAVTAAGPYYAMPSWDQTLPASTRFIVLTNMSSEAVLDRETGLVWEQTPSTDPSTWEDAQIHCIALNKGNRGGWRLPTVQELRSLVDPTQVDPALPAGHPSSSNVQSSFYWSATTDARNASYAWAVYFGSGGVISGTKNNDFYGWCVRGGHGVNPQ
jgi:Protein of unknown function (DUF1566)